MQLSADLLSEKNYTGSRLIEINDEAIFALNEELKKTKIEVEPFVVEMEKQSPALDAIYVELNPLEVKRAELKDKLKPLRDKYEKVMQEADAVYAKAELIKAKIIPLAKAIVEPQLGEFEIAGEFIERDGKIFVEVKDEIEETIKKIRARK